MSAEDNPTTHASTIRAFFARFDAEDVDGLLELFTEGATLRMPLYDEDLKGKDQLREFFRAHMDNWKEHREWATSILVDGDRAASELHYEGVAKNGAEIVMDNVNIFEFENGKILAIRIYADTWDFKHKMGLAG